MLKDRDLDLLLSDEHSKYRLSEVGGGRGLDVFCIHRLPGLEEVGQLRRYGSGRAQYLDWTSAKEFVDWTSEKVFGVDVYGDYPLIVSPEDDENDSGGFVCPGWSTLAGLEKHLEEKQKIA